MKRIVIALLMSCIVGIVFAQVNQTLEGFWGIKWDSDVETVKDAVKNKGTYPLLDGDKTSLLYEGTFGGSEARIFFFFYEEKLYFKR